MFPPQSQQEPSTVPVYLQAEAGQLDFCVVSHDTVLHAPLGNLGLTQASKKALSGTQSPAALQWRVLLYQGVNSSTAMIMLQYRWHGPKPHSASGSSVSDIEPELILCEAATEQQGWLRVSALLLGRCTAMGCSRRSFLSVFCLDTKCC